MPKKTTHKRKTKVKSSYRDKFYFGCSDPFWDSIVAKISLLKSIGIEEPFIKDYLKKKNYSESVIEEAINAFHSNLSISDDIVGVTAKVNKRNVYSKNIIDEITLI